MAQTAHADAHAAGRGIATKAMIVPVKQADLFDRWHLTQPPGADWYVLMLGTRVMAQGSLATVSMNGGYRYVAQAR
jgi:hypothetical protein